MATARRPVADIARDLIRSNAPANADPEAIERLAEKAAGRVQGKELSAGEGLDQPLREQGEREGDEVAGQAEGRRGTGSGCDEEDLKRLSEQISALTELVVEVRRRLRNFVDEVEGHAEGRGGDEGLKAITEQLGALTAQVTKLAKEESRRHT